MKYSNGTFSGHKCVLCTPTFKILGHVCTSNGWVPNKNYLPLLECWGPCQLLTKVRAFLGTVRVLWMFGKNFAHCAHHLMKLMHTRVPFKFGPDQLNAQKDLIKTLHNAKPLIPIDYKSNNHIILVVDTSYIVVRFYLCQCTSNNQKQQCYNCFSSITLNNQEACLVSPN